MCFADDTAGGDSTAIRLLKDVTSADFLGTLHLMGDVMPHLGKLSLVFQQSKVDFSSVAESIDVVTKVLNSMQKTPGPRLKSFPEQLPDVHVPGSKKYTHGEQSLPVNQNVFVSLVKERRASTYLMT